MSRPAVREAPRPDGLRPEASGRVPGAGVEAEALVKRYGALPAVDGVSFHVEPGAFVSLLGPSGCGKTTLLRLIGGFETPDAGRVLIGGEDVTRRPPQARPTAMVFQSYALFPSMTVGENVGYALRVRRRPRAEVREAVLRALARVDLGGLEDRPVSALSGGQQQRVALARAIAAEPRVLLFDEPLSNLDLALREATRVEIKALQRELGTTSVYVTHDQGEALALSDRVAVMRAGRVVGEGPPEALYAEPPNVFVARFLGGANVVEAPALSARLGGGPGPRGHALTIRPEALEVADPESPGSVPARLIARQFLGHAAEWTVEAEGERLRLLAPPAQPIPERLAIRATSAHWVPFHDAAGEPGPSAPVPTAPVPSRPLA